jgi:hypothetical protein
VGNDDRRIPEPRRVALHNRDSGDWYAIGVREDVVPSGYEGGVVRHILRKEDLDPVAVKGVDPCDPWGGDVYRPVGGVPIWSAPIAAANRNRRTRSNTRPVRGVAV